MFRVGCASIFLARGSLGRKRAEWAHINVCFQKHNNIKHHSYYDDMCAGRAADWLPCIMPTNNVNWETMIRSADLSCLLSY
jgi:hypothetical protein